MGQTWPPREGLLRASGETVSWPGLSLQSTGESPLTSNCNSSPGLETLTLSRLGGE